MVALAVLTTAVMLGMCGAAGDAAGGTLPPMPTPVRGLVVPPPTPTLDQTPPLAPGLERVYLPMVIGGEQ